MNDLISRQSAIAQPKQDREFVKLMVSNVNGRPYYSIIYDGTGHDVEGYASYSLDVISDYLKMHFMPSVRPEIIRCKDCAHQEKFWHGDKRRKDGGYYIYGCELADGYSHVCLDDDYCSRAERRTDETD